MSAAGTLGARHARSAAPGREGGRDPLAVRPLRIFVYGTLLPGQPRWRHIQPFVTAWEPLGARWADLLPLALVGVHAAPR
jgi:hypothetical protein